MSYCKYSVRQSPYQFSQINEQTGYMKISGKSILNRSPNDINGNSINGRDIVKTDFLGFDQVFIVPENKRVKTTHPKETIATSKF